MHYIIIITLINIKIVNFNNYATAVGLEVKGMRKDERRMKEEAEKVFKGVKLFVTC